jgi:ABC-type phosphate/phosphonate transport system substrate-binding protein
MIQKKIVSVVLPGFYSENAAKKIKQTFTNATYMNFVIEYSNFANNCSITVSTDCPRTTKKELYDMFVFCALNNI